MAKDVLEREAWQTDFGQFLTLVETAEKAEPFDLATFKERLLNRRVQWRGTLRSSWEGSPYFHESYVRIGEAAELARVKYYLAPNEAREWERFDHYAVVGYSGVISDVRVETTPTNRPFIAIDLRHVRLAQRDTASTDTESR